jgi:hypothetical protein
LSRAISTVKLLKKEKYNEELISINEAKAFLQGSQALIAIEKQEIEEVTRHVRLLLKDEDVHLESSEFVLKPGETALLLSENRVPSNVETLRQKGESPTRIQERDWIYKLMDYRK